MTGKKITSNLQLDAEDREFFHHLAEVIFSNPFSFEWEKLASSLGVESQVRVGEHHYTAVIPGLEQRLSRLEERGIATLNGLTGTDRALLEYAFLFRIYDQYVDAFDELIRQQIVAGDEPVQVDFALDLIQQLKDKGFSAQDAKRYLALLYQIRRAYYFIDQALIGDAPCMRQLRHALWNNVFTTDVRMYANHLWNRMEDFSTLILGETGTGKGSAAAAIGRSGMIPFDEKKKCFTHSFTSSFIATNLSEFPESLIESELFGHRKGSFTGAIDHHTGLFERCGPHSTLFLDEIGDVSIPVQIKLLKVLQDRSFTPVGSHDNRRFQGRVIAATNLCLDQRRQDGLFRDDFYYRLSSDVIQVPGLRQRLDESPEEMEQLVCLLIQRMTGQSNDLLQEEVLAAIKKSIPAEYAWPGNVRELEQAVRRILLSGKYRPQELPTSTEPPWLQIAARGEFSAHELLAAYCQMLYEKHGTYEEVAGKTGLDRRTAKKYITMEY